MYTQSWHGYGDVFRAGLTLTSVHYQITLVTFPDAPGVLSGLIAIDDATQLPDQWATEELVLTLPAERKQIPFTPMLTNLVNVYSLRPTGPMRDIEG